MYWACVSVYAESCTRFSFPAESIRPFTLLSSHTAPPQALSLDEGGEGLVFAEAALPFSLGPADGVDFGEAGAVFAEQVDAFADGGRQVVAHPGVSWPTLSRKRGISGPGFASEKSPPLGLRPCRPTPSDLWVSWTRGDSRR